jgi:polar amino acid transport system substrate-binding protein
MDDDLKGVANALAPSGVLRAAINFGNPVLAQRDGNGEPSGVSAELARELARRIGTALRFVPFETAGAVSASASANVWDVAFLADDPKRSADIFFTPPYVLIEGTYIVDANSPLKTVEDVDRPGVRIAVGLAAAYDLHLTRTLRHAVLVRCDGSRAALHQFQEGGLEAAAGIREALTACAGARPGLRVMEGSFMTIKQAMAIPKDRAAGAHYLIIFIEEMKANGFVADALSRSGQSHARIAPPAQSSD